jgi:hypothetical protein
LMLRVNSAAHLRGKPKSPCTIRLSNSRETLTPERG